MPGSIVLDDFRPLKIRTGTYWEKFFGPIFEKSAFLENMSYVPCTFVSPQYTVPNARVFLPEHMLNKIFA